MRGFKITFWNDNSFIVDLKVVNVFVFTAI